jgi:hypothetical protein
VPSTAQWLLGVVLALGQGSSFRDNPVLGDPRLNRLGLHCARLVLARAAMQARRAQLAWMVPAELRTAFDRDGFVVIEGFLPSRAHREVRDEARGHRGPVRQGVQGDTLTHRVLLDRARLRAMPATRALLADPRLRGLLRWAAGRYAPPLFYVQQVLNGIRRTGRDPQKDLHSDTFQPTLKAWYFLDDVTSDGGPFRYVPGSHRLTLGRLRWEYRQSLVAATSRNRYASRGSLRLSEADRRALGLPKARAFAVPGNTLVVADTHGFHARGEADGVRSRLEIWAYARPSPFLPIALPPVPYLGDLERNALRLWWAWQDRRAAAHGRRAPWHEVHRESLAGPP